jgi:hypothetical protein
VIRALYELGLGSRIIGRMIGYSPSQICIYANYWGIPQASPIKQAEWFESLLSHDLRSAVLRIRTRSNVYLDRAKAKEAPRTPYAHKLLDRASKPVKKSSLPVAGQTRL